jgi:maltose alpha-D-glucosyltransferase/alpha-amylase
MVGKALQKWRTVHREPPPVRALGAEQSNTSYIYGDRLVGKLLRRIENGENLELEMLQHLTARENFERVPALEGHLELRSGRGGTTTIALFQAFVPNQGDAWSFTVGEVQRYYDNILTHLEPSLEPTALAAALLERARQPLPDAAASWVGGYLDDAALLGQRTAELHLALANSHGDPDFEPERYGALAKRAFYQSLRNLTSRTLDGLRDRLPELPEAAADNARRIFAREKEVRARLRNVLDRQLAGKRIRCHGDYHLGQVLFLGNDFAILDFEGEPARSLAERRRKRSPLADVAGMLRSFHYASYGVLTGDLPLTQVRPDDRPLLENWARLWYDSVSATYLSAYLGTMGSSDLLPSKQDELSLLLDIHLLEKSLYELSYEMNNRPAWLGIPLRGILDVLDAGQSE